MVKLIAGIGCVIAGLGLLGVFGRAVESSHEDILPPSLLLFPVVGFGLIVLGGYLIYTH